MRKMRDRERERERARRMKKQDSKTVLNEVVSPVWWSHSWYLIHHHRTWMGIQFTPAQKCL